MNYDGHGINRDDGTRILTWQRKHADDGGGYVVPDAEARKLGPVFAAAPDMRRALLTIGAQHPVWNGDSMPKYDALVNGWLKSARDAVNAEGRDEDARAEWCARQYEKESKA